MPMSPIDDVLSDLRAGKPIVLVDDEDRENEGDIVYAAEACTPEAVNFMVTHARGVVCLALTGEQCDRLKLHPQSERNTAQLSTAFTVTVDAHPRFGVSTGVSARDRSISIQVAIANDAQPQDLLRPGHINPLRARDGGVLVRTGQTEGSVDLARLAGMKPAAVICEILRDDGEMMRRPDLELFCAKHGLRMCSIADLISYRLQREQFVKRVESVSMPTQWGDFRLHAYQSILDPQPHLAYCLGGIGEKDPAGSVVAQPEPVLVRVHRECLLGDVFGAKTCPCGGQLSAAFEAIRHAGKGVLIYLRQASPQPTCPHESAKSEGTSWSSGQREYGIGIQILHDLGVSHLRILTNRPRKLHGIEGFGLHVVDQVPFGGTPALLSPSQSPAAPRHP
jgi:3,4-dihydroxy 2-butanone 4-phosphate synthase/GTP cyclohydrolase II